MIIANIRTALQITGNAREKLESIASAAYKTAEIIERIPTSVDIDAGGSANAFQDIDNTMEMFDSITAAASRATEVIENIPANVNIDPGGSINALHEVGAASESLESIISAATRTTEVIENIPASVNIDAGKSVSALHEVGTASESFESIISAATRTTEVIENIPTSVNIDPVGSIKALHEIGTAGESLESITAAANRATEVIENIPDNLDINAGRSLDDLMAINDAINAAIERFSELKEGASSIQFNEIEKLNLMKREFDNNQKMFGLMNGTLTKTKEKWEAMAAATGRNSSEALKLYAEYLKVDKQVNTLDKSNYRILSQIDKQIAKLEALKYPLEDVSKFESVVTDVTESFTDQSSVIESTNDKITTMQDNLEALKYPLEDVSKFESVVTDVTERFTNQRSAVESTNNKLTKMQGNIDKLNYHQDGFNSRLREANTAADSLGNKISGYIKKFMGVMAIKKGLESTIGAAAELSQQVQLMQGIFGNKDIGSAYFNQLQDYALKAGLNINELSNITQQFLGVTRNTDNLMKLNKLAEKLLVKNTSQDLEGAGKAITEALSGRYSSLQRSFQLTPAQLEPIKKAVEKGNFNGIVEAFDKGLNMAGITDDVVNTYRNTATSQWDSILNGFKMKFAKAGMSALSAMEPIFARILSWLESDSSTQFFNGIAMGINLTIVLLSGLFDLITSNWDILKIVFITLAIVMTAYQMISLATAASTAAAWAAAHWPLLLIIAIIGLLVSCFIKAGGKIEDVIGAIGGTLGVLKAFIINTVAVIWNTVVSLAEFLVNVFIDPVYAIQKLFYDLSIDVLSFFNGIISGIASGINWIINKSNSLLGTNFNPIEFTFLDNVITTLEANMPTAGKNFVDVVNFDDMKIGYEDYNKSWNSGFDKGNKLASMISNTFDGFGGELADIGGYNSMQTDYLGSIDGKTKNSLNLADEELKYLKDIAEREAINLFTTKAVVPKLQVYFGDVHETADVKKIYGQITEMVSDEMLAMNEGVHE